MSNAGQWNHARSLSIEIQTLADHLPPSSSSSASW